MIVNGAKNPNRSAVAKDITEAILETRAGKGASAVYQSKPEQESYLSAAFIKWSVHGGVWSAAVSKVHTTYIQLQGRLLNNVTSRHMLRNYGMYKKVA